MKILGLDNKEYTLKLEHSKRKKQSKYHKRAKSLLINEFPCHQIYEEITLPGTKNERQPRPLFVDFYIPLLYLMIEVQGEQHYKYNDFFYKENKLEFYRAQTRDRNKREWCDLNNITLIELPYFEDENEWLTKIRNRQ